MKRNIITLFLALASVINLHAAITYELNGGVTNDYGWMSKSDMFQACMEDAYGYDIGISLNEFKQDNNPYIYLLFTLEFNVSHCQNILDNSRWDWLEDYLVMIQEESVAATLTKGYATVDWRYAIAAFFFEGQYSTSSDYSQFGKYEEYILAWKHAYDNPTSPKKEWTLNAPYKEGATFEGWYTTANFTGEQVTTVDASTTGTLYAKWNEESTIDPSHQILYTTTDEQIISIDSTTTAFGANFISNTYENGQGLIIFDGPVTKFDAYCLHNRTTLETIVIPDSVQKIGYQALSNLTSLKSIHIPKAVTNIEYHLENCPSLESITVEEGNLVYDSRNNCNAIIESATHTLFQGCKNTIIPNTVVSIGSGAFQDCSSLTSITIPTSVTSMLSSAFSGCTSLTKTNYLGTLEEWCNIKFGHGSIYDNANPITFSRNLYLNDQLLEHLVIPTTIDTIYPHAFYGCASIMSLVIPQNVVEIGYRAFAYCPSIESIVVEGGNQTYDSRNNCHAIIETATNTLVTGCQNTSIPNGVTTIGDYSFLGCTSLSRMDVTEGVTDMGSNAFEDCSSLHIVTLPSTIEYLGAMAFQKCPLDTVYSYARVAPPLGGPPAFYQINPFVSVIPCGTTADYEAKLWNSYCELIENCENVDDAYKILYTSTDGNIVTPYNPSAFGANIISNTYENGQGVISFDGPVTSIGNNAFEECHTLSKITIPLGVTDIGDYAFYYCYEMTSVDIPASVKTIGEGAFCACARLDTLALPAGLISIGSEAFQECATIRRVIIPNSVTHIGESAFSDCQLLQHVTLPNNLTTLERSVFEDCVSLRTIDVPNGLTSIKGLAFSNCPSLVSLTIPQTVTSIDVNAFAYCYFAYSNLINNSPLNAQTSNYWGATMADEEINGLLIRNKTVVRCRIYVDEVSIPEHVTGIGKEAFSNCMSIRTLLIPNNVLQIGEGAFTYCDSLESIDLSDNITILNASTFSHCSSLTKIDIPIGVKQIGDKAFQYCSKLTEVVIPNNVTTIGKDAFSWCNSLYSATIGKSVQTIGGSAFHSCEMLTHLILLPITPPSLGSILTSSSPVAYVPCGSLEVYQQSDWAEHVANILENCENVIRTEEAICYGSSYTWEVNGNVYDQSGVYYAYDGDVMNELNLIVYPEVQPSEESVFICHGENYTWNGQTYSTAGEYTLTLSNTLGCDSVATLHLTIMPEAVSTTETVVIGSDALPYTWRGNSYTATGRYTNIEQYTTVACDSAIHILDLTVLTTDNYEEQSVTICDTEAPYLWYGESYTTTGKYTITEQYVGTNIDSIQHILNLTVNPTIYTEEYITACDSYTWNGSTYATTGAYTYTTTATNGCDSIVTLHLTINNSEVGETEYATICHGETYIWNGQTYSTAGEYSVTLSNANGCDSVATVRLSIMPKAQEEVQYETIKKKETPFVWDKNGKRYYETTLDSIFVPYTHHDCDSMIYILDLTVVDVEDVRAEYDTICESALPYEWNGQSITTGGRYEYTEKYGETNIDILNVLYLTITPTIRTQQSATICYGETFAWNGSVLTQSDTYTYTTDAANGCDSVTTLHLTVLPQAITIYTDTMIAYADLPYQWRGLYCNTSGEYTSTIPFAANVVCDSVIYVLHLTVEAANKCGANLSWKYQSGGVLNITGSGAMYDNPEQLTYRSESWYPSRVRQITLPNTLTHIGNVAFADCSNLTHIVIPNSVNSIGDGAFSWTGLQSITIPASVTELGEQVFEACSNLHTIIYEGYPTVISNQAIHPLIGCVHLDTVIAPVALWHCTNADKALENRYGVPHKARYIEVTDGLLTNQAVKYIAQNATALEVLDLTNTTNTTLPYGAFSHSYLLTQLYLPAYIETLPESMIEGGSRLSEITIPATVTEIGNYAFAGCVNIWRMTVEATTPPKVHENTFDGISRSISVLVPAGSEQAYREAEYWREFFIDNTNSPLPISNCQKILREDQILILREGKVYTTMGQLINTEE